MLSDQEKSLYIPLVDESDRLIGYETKEIVHEQGLLHRAFSIFVYRYVNNQLEILLQKRAHFKYHSANLWANTCCSHPYWKELSIEKNGNLNPNPEEIAEHCWVSLDEINSQMQGSSERFTPWFEEAFKLMKTNMNRE